MQSLQPMCCKKLVTSVTGLKGEPACRALFFTCALLVVTACAGSSTTPAVPSPEPDTQVIEAVSSSRPTPPDTVAIPAGAYIAGSDQQEREYAYQLDEAAYGHSRTRTGGWYDRERTRATATTEAYEITVSPVTNIQYRAFIDATNHPVPDVDEATWRGYGLVHPYDRTRRHAWQNNQLPANREQHPVVMVSYNDAQAYAAWLSETRNEVWRLPTEDEWEKAVRGTDGSYFPWGNDFNSANLNSHDAGPFDTVAVGTASSTGPFGLVDGAGQVFEWITTDGAQRAWVKGGSWDDQGCGVCRPAARHSRPKSIKHILVGFRLVKTQ